MLATLDQCWLCQEVFVDQVVFSGWVLLTIFFRNLQKEISILEPVCCINILVFHKHFLLDVK